MFQITLVMTRSLSFSWQRPVTLNRSLTGYQLFCKPLLPDIPSPQILNTTAVAGTVSGLYPGVGYNCSIVARNSAGPSDPVYISRTTLETGTYPYLFYFLWWAKTDKTQYNANSHMYIYFCVPLIFKPLASHQRRYWILFWICFSLCSRSHMPP